MRKHHGSAALRVLHQFGTATHHGSGEAFFWLAVFVLFAFAVGAALGNRRRSY